MERYKSKIKEKLSKIADYSISDIIFSIEVDIQNASLYFHKAKINIDNIIDINKKIFEYDYTQEYQKLSENIRKGNLYLISAEEKIAILINKLYNEFENENLKVDSFDEYQKEFDFFIKSFINFLELLRYIVTDEDSLRIIIKDKNIRNRIQFSANWHNKNIEKILEFARVFKQRKGKTLKNLSELKLIKRINMKQLTEIEVDGQKVTKERFVVMQKDPKIKLVKLSEGVYKKLERMEG